VFHALKALLSLVELDLLLPVSKRQLVESIFPLSLHPKYPPDTWGICLAELTSLLLVFGFVKHRLALYRLLVHLCRRMTSIARGCRSSR
jgi:hypothetical protein